MALTTKQFIEKAKDIHGDKYDYSKTEYKTNQTKVCIVCLKHGEFWQTPANHTHKTLKQGCPICKKESLSTQHFLSEEEVLTRFYKVHGNKYDYSQVEFKGMNELITIRCNQCGHLFKQIANSHYHGSGCPKCAGKLLNTQDVIQKAKDIHGDKYDYSKTEYINAKTKLCIICPKHGEFWQRKDKHINQKQGCPMCRESKLENEIRKLLIDKNIKFESQKRFKWLGNQSLDFYLPDYNVGIECQGIQHFKPVDFGFNNKELMIENFNKIKSNDKLKKSLCAENQVKLIYYSDTNYPLFLGDNCFSNSNDLLATVLNQLS